MCKYCDGERSPTCKNIYHPDYDVKPCGRGDQGCMATMVIDDDGPEIVIMKRHSAEGYFNINFCPICGRNLKGE